MKVPKPIYRRAFNFILMGYQIWIYCGFNMNMNSTCWDCRPYLIFWYNPHVTHTIHSNHHHQSSQNDENDKQINTYSHTHHMRFVHIHSILHSYPILATYTHMSNVNSRKLSFLTMEVNRSSRPKNRSPKISHPFDI